MADIALLTARFTSEGHETVKGANRDVARTGKDAKAATDALGKSQEVQGAKAKGAATANSTAAKAIASTDTVSRQAALAQDRLAREFDDTSRAVRGTSGAMSTLNGVMASNQTRQVGMQLSQLSQQAMAGGGFIRALAIQLPDIGLSFGTIGIAAGVAAGALLPLVANMMGAGDASEDLEDQLDSLATAMEAQSAAADDAGMSTEELREKYGAFADTMRSTLALIRETANAGAQRQIDNLSQSLADLLGTAGAGDSRAELAGFFDVSTVFAFTDAQREARAEARALTAEFQNGQDALANSNGNIDEQITSTQKMLVMATALANVTGGINDEEQELIDNLAATLDLMLQQKKATDEMDGGITRATKSAQEMIDKLQAEAKLRDDINGYIRRGYTDTQARFRAEQDAFRVLVDSKEISAELKNELNDAWDAANGIADADMVGGIDAAANRAAQLAEDMGISLQAARQIYSIGGGRGGDPRAMGGTGFDRSYNSAFPDAARNERLYEAAQKGILDLIAVAEGTAGHGDYNATLDYGKWTNGPQNLVNMSLNEVLALGDKMRTPENRATYAGGGSSALGRYQIVGNTMRDLMSELDLSGNELYSPEMQDRMAEQLVRRRMGQGTNGMRNEWQGLNDVSPDLIGTALGAQSIDRVDPTLATEATRAQAEAKREAEKAAKDEARAVEQSQKSYDSLIGSLDPAIAATQKFDEAQKSVTEALARGQITTEQAARAIELAREELTQAFLDIDEALIDSERFDELKDGFQGIAESLYEAAMNGDNLLEVLLQIIAQRLLMKGLDQISGGLAMQATANPGGFLAGASRFLSFDGGGSTGSGSRTGGLDGKGGFTALLHPNETVIDHTKGQTLGNTQSVTQTVNIVGASGDAQIRQLVAQGVQQGMAQVRKDVPGIVQRHTKVSG